MTIMIRIRLKRSSAALTGFFLAVLLFLGGSPDLTAEKNEDIFPRISILESNVAFWKQVYSYYPSSTGILHDKNNLGIIYEIIPLEKRTIKGSTRRNRKKIKQARKRYRTILANLIAKKKLFTAEEKRVLELFGPTVNDETLKIAKDSIRYQKGQKDRFLAGIIRSGAYLEHIRSIFKSYDLPVDLAYLPHVESSFNYNAYSKVGAAGIWQFTRSTGRRYMNVNYVVDERRDPIRATYAAAKYLKNAYEKLGNWPLAVTAYNHGLNGMRRAKKQHPTPESVFANYDGRLFKFASRNFYAEFLAAREIAANHHQYFGEQVLDKPVITKIVKLPGYSAAKDLSKYFGVGLPTLKRLNPGLRNPVFSGQKYIPKNYLLRLPDLPTVLAKAIEMPENLFYPKQRRIQLHRVRKGEVAGAIARRMKLSLRDLILANNLDYRARIYVGQILRIPNPVEITQNRQKAVEKRKVQRQQRAQLAVKMATLEDQNPAHLQNKDDFAVKHAAHLSVKRVYQTSGKKLAIIHIEGGETLGHYADWAKIPINHLRRLNRIDRRHPIQLNRPLKIPLKNVTKEQFEQRRFEYHKELEEDFLASYEVDSVWFYEVKNGENIWTLCQSVFEVPFWLVKRYNPDLELNSLMPNQKLVVPQIRKIG